MASLSKNELDILLYLKEESFTSQRKLAAYTRYSLGNINSTLKKLVQNNYLTVEYKLTSKAEQLFMRAVPRKAIILAAGYGMRMVPINTMYSKAFLEVQGEKLIERQIQQLHEVGITDISIVVGYMKERFEYLVDKYHVDLIVNEQYAERNNLHSLSLAADRIDNTYIVPTDIWSKENPFRKHELYSWYMVSDLQTKHSDVRVTSHQHLQKITDQDQQGNAMVGIAYLTGQTAAGLKEKLLNLDHDKSYNNSFWEAALYSQNRMVVYPREVSHENVAEINTYEQLRDLDENSDSLSSDAIDVIAQEFAVEPSAVTNITVLKKGMTNRSFLFTCKQQKYIMRIPGEGTDQLVNRQDEAEVYAAIKDKQLCDNPVYLNPNNGYKITKFLDDVRTCDSNNEEDLEKCISLLRRFHEMHLQVNHDFDLFDHLNFYEQLWNGQNSVYEDYLETKKHVFELKSYIDAQPKDKCLTHIDANADNFLFYSEEGQERLQLIDWEYAGMQDPHVDIAMFGIYSMYDKQQMDHLIDLYFDKQCPAQIRAKIYCYIAVCGLLWSNWCEYKSQQGVEFGKYSLAQYRYAKEYYQYAKELIDGQSR